MDIQEDEAQDGQGDATEPRGQPVDAVDQVDGVRDVDHDEQRERYAYPGGDGVYAEQAAERAEPVAGERQQRRRQYLHQELVPVSHAHQVVAHAHQVEERHAHEEEQELVEHAERQAGEVGVVHVEVQPHDQEERHQDHGEERQPSQPRDRRGVHLPGVRDVVEPFLVGDHEDPRDDDHAEHHRQQEAGR